MTISLSLLPPEVISHIANELPLSDYRRLKVASSYFHSSLIGRLLARIPVGTTLVNYSPPKLTRLWYELMIIGCRPASICEWVYKGVLKISTDYPTVSETIVFTSYLISALTCLGGIFLTPAFLACKLFAAASIAAAVSTIALGVLYGTLKIGSSPQRDHRGSIEDEIKWCEKKKQLPVLTLLDGSHYILDQDSIWKDRILCAGPRTSPVLSSPTARKQCYQLISPVTYKKLVQSQAS